MFDQISGKEDLDGLIIYYLKNAAICSAVYGATLGFYAFNLQVALAAIKLPLLLLSTMGVCLPSLYLFNVLLRSRLTFKQTAAVMAMATYLMSTVLVSLAPIMFFFAISTINKEFLLIMNVAFCGTAGTFALLMVWSGMRYLSMKSEESPRAVVFSLWMLIYMFTGTQLSWMLRPFIGVPGEVALLRPMEGNFYEAVYKTFMHFVLG